MILSVCVCTVCVWTLVILLVLFVSLHVTLYSAIQHLCCNYVNKTQFSGEFLNDVFVANFLLNVPLKEFRKSVNI